MATHDMSQGQRLADMIGVLMNGEILQTGSPSEIFCSPSNKEVAEFVGVENILSGIISQKDGDLVAIDVNGATIEAISEFSVGDKVYVIIRPEDITFTLAKETSSARNMFQGEIARMTTVGQLARIEVDCGFPLLGVVTKRSAEELNFNLGKKIYASFKATAVHVIK